MVTPVRHVRIRLFGQRSVEGTHMPAAWHLTVTGRLVCTSVAWVVFLLPPECLLPLLMCLCGGDVRRRGNGTQP